MSDWRLIESAPKDGTPVLLYCPSDNVMQVGYWNPQGDSWVDENGSFYGKAHHLEVTGCWFSGGGWFQPNEVSHWMPLPEPPKGGHDE